ncbi:FAD-binding family [Colletotrichum asianum]|uniref:FAD-binding family n=1 Tax=Colletotrichum asianum TaxID=702518 RepID=A0A8H3W9G8_9PEZI|nr:FAD-binding family [Colletotrichum asianum]
MVNIAQAPENPSDESHKPPATTTVLIVGAGPAGLMTAYLLARQQIPSIIITRYPSRLGQPKAHAVNPRSLEIMRQAGLDINKLRSLGSTTQDSFWVRFNLGLAAQELGKLPYERQDEAVKDVTPEPLFNVAQPVLEDFLQEAVLLSGMVSIYSSWDWEDVEFDEGKLISLIASRSDASTTVKITSQYIVGADGGDSIVRSRLSNVVWVSPDGIERPKRFYCSIHASGDLTRSFANRDRRGQLSFCLNPDHRGGVIIYDPQHSWVHVRPIELDREPLGSFTDARCQEIIRSCIGSNVEAKILSVNVWNTWPKVASAYSDTTQRFHLVGDSAHSFPPQGGLGINTGIGDAHNLAWKLGIAIRSGTHLASLLVTYSEERQPVAVANSVQSAYNEARWLDLNKTVEKMVRKASAERALFSCHAMKMEFEQSLALNKPHFDSLALQIGYVYDKSRNSKTLLADCSDYQPSSAMGARLPHAWLAAGRSTLDLIPAREFSLLHYDRGLKYPSSCRKIGSSDVLIRSVDVSIAGAAGPWISIMGLRGETAVLVRPDQHILGHPRSADEAWAIVGRYLGKEAGLVPN